MVHRPTSTTGLAKQNGAVFVYVNNFITD